MKLHSLLVAAGFLSTLSAAVPAPTPTFTASGTMNTVEAVAPPATSAPTLMPRFDVEDYCARIELGLIENKEFRKITLNRTGKTRITRTRLHPRMDLKEWCTSIREGKLTYRVHHLHPGHNKITLAHNPWGDP